MKKFYFLFIYTMIICHTLIPMADSIISEGLRVPSPQDYNPINSNVEANIAPASPNMATPAVNMPTQSNPSPNIIFSTSSQSEFPLSVRKTILNASQDGYIINDPIWILVEIKCLSDKQPRTIEIYERADKNLEIINYTSPLIAINLNDTYSYEMIKKKIYYPNKLLNSFYFNISQLRLKQSVLYMFCIKPKALGLLNTETIVRVGGNGSFLSDDYHNLEILSRDPNFDVRAYINKLGEQPEKDLQITYIIKYKEGWRSKPKPIKFNISIGDLCNDNSVIINPNKYELMFNPPDYTSNKTISVTFKKNGIYPIPEIKIGNDNNDIYLFQQDRITIEELWHKYISELSLLSLGLSALISALISVRFVPKKPSKYVKKIFRYSIWLIPFIFLFIAEIILEFRPIYLVMTLYLFTISGWLLSNDDFLKKFRL